MQDKIVQFHFSTFDFHFKIIFTTEFLFEIYQIKIYMLFNIINQH